MERKIETLPESVIVNMLSQAKEEAFMVLSERGHGRFFIFHEDEDRQIDLICNVSGEMHKTHDECGFSEEINFSQVSISVNFNNSDPIFSESLKRDLEERIESEVEDYLTA